MGLLHAGLKRLARDADLLTAPVSSVEQLLQPDSQNKHRATTLVKLDMRELSQRFAAVYEPGGCMSQKRTCAHTCAAGSVGLARDRRLLPYMAREALPMTGSRGRLQQSALAQACLCPRTEHHAVGHCLTVV